MILSTSVPIPPPNQPATQQNWAVDLTVDLAAHVVTVFVRMPSGPPLVDSQPVPAAGALMTALQTYAKARAEVLLGVANGSTTISTP